MSADSTRARVYRRAMRIARRPLNHVALALIAAALACGDNDAPPKEPGEYGEACKIGEKYQGTPEGCAGSLYCYLGYCTHQCVVSDECPLISGYEHPCEAGLCKIMCDDNDECPQTLAVPLECSGSRNCLPPEE